jgi:Protein of unknown function (DUF1761)
MSFAGMNYLAVLVAAIAAWLFGAVYYTVLSKPWLAAVGITMDEMKRRQAEGFGKLKSMFPFMLSFIAEIVMAWVLAGVLGHLGPGQVTIRNGLISALFLWFGFILTTIATNNAYPGRSPMLTVLDAGHWLGVMLIMGAIIGAFGA